MNTKKKSPAGVLLIVDKLDLGGGARRIKVYADLLDRSLYTPSVVFRTSVLHRDVDAVIGKDTPRLHSSDPEKIVSFATHQNVKVVYCWYDGQFHQDLFDLLTQLKKKKIAVVANNVFSYVDERMNSLCDVVVFQTKFMLYKFERQLTATQRQNKKYVVLPNPVHDQYCDQFALTTQERDEKRLSLGFSAKDVVFGRFGRNDIVKWGDGLTGAMLWHLHNPTIKFLIVGMPRSRRWLFSLLRFLDPSIDNSIKILPPTSSDKELFALMQCTDVIAHSVKIGEGCSNAINEGMFWGKAVITNPTPHCDNGQVEQVVHERFGLIVRGVAEWNKAIQQLASDTKRRQHMGDQARENVLTQIRGEIIVKKFEQVLDFARGVSVSSKLITPVSLEYKSFVDEYVSNPRISGSVLPVSVVGKLGSFILRGLAYLEFRFFNG